MHPYYFGDSQKPLFGVYHLPRSERIRNVGVVMCYPAGQEYMLSHRALKQLSTLLSKAGFHVMRFDYYGTGDSSGDSREVNLDLWKSNIHVAIEELKDSSGVKKVVLMGLRLGAALTVATSIERTDITDLVLWDPVVNGKAYIDQLTARHQSRLTDPGHFRTLHVQSLGTDELLGFPFPKEMRSAIQQIDLLHGQIGKAERTFLIISEETEDHAQLCEALKTANIQFECRIVANGGGWDEILMPYETLQIITSLLTKEPI
jgi:pimeloyl-ACP methyl ester carboxylesterase